jgi:hypothetical protein
MPAAGWRNGDAAAIVARIPREAAAAAMVGELRTQLAPFEHLSPDSHADIVSGLERTLARWSRFTRTGVMPPENDFDPLREWTRKRATEGVRLEELLRAFGLIHQVGWDLLRRAARDEEQAALLDLAGSLASYMQRVSATVAETYLAQRELLVAEEERRTRGLLERLSADVPLDTADRELAERLGVPLDRAYAPFAIAIPGSPVHRLSRLAARLRREGWRLTVTQSDAVVGLTWRPIETSHLGERSDVVLVVGDEVTAGALGAARRDVEIVLSFAREAGLSGRVEVGEHLLELALGRCPDLVGRLRASIVGPLARERGTELEPTLRAFVGCHFERGATSEALHIHRNTLAYRLRRIEQITGLDLASPRDLAAVYAALQADWSA